MINLIQKNNIAYLGLGSNRGNREQYIRNTLWAFDRYKDTEIEALSSLYETIPWGNKNQSNYLNCVLKISTNMNPENLLCLIHGIEAAFGRTRNNKIWEPRTIDIDILLFNDLLLNTKELKIPHPEMELRPFTIIPIAEISPELIIPVSKKKAFDLIKNVDTKKILKVKPFPYKPAWRLFPHTADQGIEGWGNSIEEAVWALVNGYCDLTVHRDKIKEYDNKILNFSGNIENCIVSLLEEIIYLGEVKKWFPRRVCLPIIIKNNETYELKVKLYGQESSVSARRHIVKAITYHELSVGFEKNKWRAKVIVDV